MALVSIMVEATRWSHLDYYRTEARAAPQDRWYVGAAIGLVMGLHGITESQARDLMELSGRLRHRSLGDVARDVLGTGHLEPF